MENRYTTKLSKLDARQLIISVDVFETELAKGSIFGTYGYGCWCKDGYSSKDNVFENNKEDATHVLWRADILNGDDSELLSVFGMDYCKKN